MAMGVALGACLGVALSIVTHNWGMLAIAMGVGVAIGASRENSRRSDQSED